MRLMIAKRAFASALAGSMLLSGVCAFAQAKPVSTPIAARLQSTFAHLPLRFEPNRGQTDAQVQFLARTPQGTVYLSGSDAVFRVANLQRYAQGQTAVHAKDAIRMHLAGASALPEATVEEIQPGTTNYLSGKDRSKWHTGLPGYGGVKLSAVYPGVDLRYHGHQGQLEYDFIVSPGSDATGITMQFEGTTAKLDGNGDLLLPTGVSADLRFEKPVAYQTIEGKRVPVDASFTLAANKDVAFHLGAYDKSRELVIDPTLVYLGTIGNGVHQVDVGQVTVDSAGAMYFIGTTDDVAFPVTSGAYQTVCGPTAGNAGQVTYYGGYCPANGGGETSAYVTKLSADGTRLIYSTYLSGKSGVETGGAIAVDSAGVAYLLGRTGSNDFPVTSDAFQKNCVSYYHVFGGPNDVACDGYYNGGGTQYTINNEIAYFAKLSADGTSLLYSSYLGGTLPVYPNTIALDASGSIYVSGQVAVLDPASLAPCADGYQPKCQPNIQFPGITSSGYQTGSAAVDIYNAQTNINNAAFLSKFSNDGHTLQYGTFFSDNTNGADLNPTVMAVGTNGVAFLGGYTTATNYPTTAGAIKPACSQTSTNYNGIYCNVQDGYLASIDTTKSGTASLVYSTRLGGTSLTQGNNYPQQQVLGLTADSSNNAYVTGHTSDSTFNVGTKGFQVACPNNTGNVAPTTTGYIDRCDSAFVLKINPTGTAILAGTFLGSPSLRGAGSTGYNVRLDSKGQIYLYGLSNDGGGDFPQVNPLQAYKGGNQLFISTFTTDLTKLLFSTRFGNPSYTDHAVSVAGGMALDANDAIYFAGTTKDVMFAATTGTYQTAAATGAGDHTFFAKFSKVLQPDTTVLTIAPNPVGQNTPVTYKAVVAGTLQITPVATGTVTFTATNTTPSTLLGTATLDSTGTATLSVNAPTAGSYTVVASYGADTTYDTSTSAAVSLTVNNTVATTTTLVATPAAAKAGAAVTFAATVAGSGGTPTGTVTFLDGSTILGTAALANGSASYSTTALAIANHVITARYSGDTAFAASTSAAQSVTVSANTVALGLSAAPAVATPGTAITLTATLSGATGTNAPTGSITFNDGTAVLGTVTIASGVATLKTTALAAGTHSITATYSGDSGYGTASASAQTVVIRSIAATTITLSSSSASVALGSSVTFTATLASAVTSGSPSGTVTFLDGTTTLGTGTLSGVTSTYTTTALALGTHSITAVYSGDSLFLTSTSAALTQTVVAANIALSASPSSLTIAHGSSGSTTISVTPTGAYSGSLTFSCGTLPKYATCTFTPATLTFASSSAVQTVTLTIYTKSGVSAMLQRSSTMAPVLAGLFLPLALFGFVRRKAPFALLVLALAVSLGALGLTGCGGTETPTVAAGTYTIPVVATVNGSTSTLNLSVTVQ